MITSAVVVLLVLSLVSLGGMIRWAFSSSTPAIAATPDNHLVPPAKADARTVAESVDLSTLGLTFRGITTIENGAAAVWLDSHRRPVRFELLRLPSPDKAYSAYEAWINGFHIQVAALRNDSPGHSVALARVPGAYIYGWQADTWLVMIRIPTGTDGPTQLCASVRDALFLSFEGFAEPTDAGAAPGPQ